MTTLIVALTLLPTGGALAADIVAGSLQFDLVCNLQGKVVADPHPTLLGTNPANAKQWSDAERYIIDIHAMRYCDPVTCQRLGPQQIHALTPTQIVFRSDPSTADPSYEWYVRRSDGRSEDRLVAGERVSVTVGWCKREKFSGFPDRSHN